MSRRFKYIKPEEVEEYRSRGYKIEEGPRGGIRAYFPDVGDSNVNFVGNALNGNLGSNLVAFLREMKEVGRDKLDGVDRAWSSIVLSKAVNSLGSGRIDFCLSYVAAVVLEFPDVFGDFVERFWGSEDNFEKWVNENVIRVSDKRLAESIVGKSNLFVVGGGVITFRSLVKHSILSHIKAKNLFKYVWFRNRKFLDEFRENVDGLRSVVGEAFVNGDAVLDGVVNFVVGVASVVEDILNQESVDIDDEKFVGTIEKFNLLVQKRLPFLENLWSDDFDVVNSGYFSFENLFGDLLDSAEEFMDKFSARLFVFAFIFMELGFSKEEAFSLAKGWEITRFWTGSSFKTYTHYVEKLIVECRGNGRPVRKPYKQPGEYGLVFFSRYASCKDLENWRKFVQAYLRSRFGDKIRVYRGVKAREVGQAVIDYILDGEVRLGGVAESSTVDERVASSWGWFDWVFTAEIPVEYVIGCWLNASRSYADNEMEVMFEKPVGGLVGRMTNIDIFQEAVFSKEVYDNVDVRNIAIKIMEKGLESIKRTYGEDSEFYRAYVSRMLRAKSILMSRVMKSLEKLLDW